MIRIVVTSVSVDDQAKALAFYTDVLGFRKKTDVPAGEFRWLTVVSPAAPDGVELLLEPNEHSRAFQESLYSAGIPATAFGTDDIHAEYERLRALGVVFTGEPVDSGFGFSVVLDDTCGNLIQLVQR